MLIWCIFNPHVFHFDCGVNFQNFCTLFLECMTVLPHLRHDMYGKEEINWRNKTIWDGEGTLTYEKPSERVDSDSSHGKYIHFSLVFLFSFLLSRSCWTYSSDDTTIAEWEREICYFMTPRVLSHLPIVHTSLPSSLSYHYTTFEAANIQKEVGREGEKARSFHHLPHRTLESTWAVIYEISYPIQSRDCLAFYEASL